jgi:ketosteroid isomerase-like protein
MRLTRYSFVILAVVLALSVFPITAIAQANSSATDAAAVVTITQMENASVKADMAGDSAFVEKNYAENFTSGSSWGNWETKQSILADMKDSKNNKTNSEAISELSVRVYGDAAVVTYKSTYDSLYHGDRRARTILSTDTFARQNGSWKLVASHSSELAK